MTTPADNMGASVGPI